VTSLHLFLLFYSTGALNSQLSPSELGVLLLGPHSQPFFALASMDHDLPIYTSSVAGMIGVYHGVQLFVVVVEMGA
jgi:hypothetical protein